MVKQRVIESVVSTDPMTKRWKGTFATASLAYSTGDLRQAKNLLTGALEMSKELPERRFAVPSTQIALAAVELADGNAKVAETKLARAVTSLEGASNNEDKELLAVALRFHAECLIILGDERTAEKELMRSVEILEKLELDGVVQRAYSLSDLCGLYLQQGRISQAEQYITQAVAIFGNVFGPGSPEYVRADVLYSSFSPMSEETRLDTVGDGIQRMEYAYGHKHPNIARAVARYLKALEAKGDTDRLSEAKGRFASALK